MQQKKLRNDQHAEMRPPFVIEGPKRFPHTETMVALPKEADPTDRLRLQSRKWLMDVLKGIKHPEYAESERTTKERVKKMTAITLASVAKYKIPEYLLGIDAIAWGLQTAIFKPAERKKLLRAFQKEQTMSKQVAEIERAINASKHFTPEEGTALLEKIWVLSDTEIANMTAEDLLATSSVLGVEFQPSQEQAFSLEASQQIKQLIKEHIQSRVSVKKAILDAVLTALVFKGGIILKPLGKAAKVIYVAAKGVKVGKTIKKTTDELRRVANVNRKKQGTFLPPAEI